MSNMNNKQLNKYVKQLATRIPQNPPLLNMYMLKDEYKDEQMFSYTRVYLLLGECAQMRGHYVYVEMGSGIIFAGYHDDRFEPYDQDRFEAR